MQVSKDGQSWRIGTAADVVWIARKASSGITITTAIPPVFAAYAIFDNLAEVTPIGAQEAAVVWHLTDHAGDQPWWLGFLDTGAHDIVFDEVPKVSLYCDWRYVLVQAGPSQALSWRTGHMRHGYGVLPDLFFPADRSWLVSGLWDDTWTCVGGPAQLIRDLRDDPRVGARVVGLDEDAAPPGHRDL